jgi:hypothetical protein
MHYRRINVRELSLACGDLKYRSTIGHLHSGTRSTCGARLARRIEEGLLLTPGSLFDLVVCNTSTDFAASTPTRGRRAA